MAVCECGLWPWAHRLEVAAGAVRRAVVWLTSPADGPFSAVYRMATSDVWAGPFPDQLRGALRALDAALVPCADHLVRLHTALDQAIVEVKMALAAEANGTASTYDPVAALAPWRRWPVASLPLPAGWASTGGTVAGPKSGPTAFSPPPSPSPTPSATPPGRKANPDESGVDGETPP